MPGSNRALWGKSFWARAWRMGRTPLPDMAVERWGLAARLRRKLELDPESGWEQDAFRNHSSHNSMARTQVQKKMKLWQAGQEKTVEGLKCPAEELGFLNDAEIQWRNNAMLGLGSGEVHNCSRHGGFTGGARKRQREADQIRSSGHRSAVLRARKRPVAGESNGWMAVCLFILRWHTPRGHWFSDIPGCLDWEVLVPWAKPKRWKYSSPTDLSTGSLKTRLVASV